MCQWTSESVTESVLHWTNISIAALNTMYPQRITLNNEDLINTPECSQLDVR